MTDKEETIAADKLDAAAKVAAEVTAAAANVAVQARLEEARIAAKVQSLEFYKIIVLPIALALIVAIPTTITSILAASKVSSVGVDVEKIKQTSEKVHKLVNSAHLASLRTNAELSAWKAMQTKDPLDIQAAEAAALLVQEHIEKQRKADLE